MDWYTPDPNVKELLEITRDVLQAELTKCLIRSLEAWQAQFSRCRNKHSSK